MGADHVLSARRGPVSDAPGVLSLCALTSGQCLLSQSPFGRLLWEKNFVVVLQKRRGMRKHEKEEAS